MKILHVCLACFYVDNYGYQENILPKMHKKQGHEVKIIASTETFIDGKKLGYVKPSTYFNADGIEVTRIAYSPIIPFFINKKLRVYKNFYSYLLNYKPDFIFLHDVQFLSLNVIRKYAKNFSVRIVADGHTDFINSASNFLSKRILHGIIYKSAIRKTDKYISVYYGTLPARVEFFSKMYGLDKRKCKLLLMGGDDDLIKAATQKNSIITSRKKCRVSKDDFVILTGGKIDNHKPQILTLIKAFKEMQLPNNFKMVVFGSVYDELKSEFDTLINSKNIIFIGWCTNKEIYNLMQIANLIVFPGLHSVLWEQAVASGKACVFKKIEGFEHIDLGGNCIFLNEETIASYKEVLKRAIDTADNMEKIAKEKGMEVFSYEQIAKHSLE